MASVVRYGIVGSASPCEHPGGRIHQIIEFFAVLREARCGFLRYLFGRALMGDPSYGSPILYVDLLFESEI
jgi:hypothetical protein